MAPKLVSALKIKVQTNTEDLHCSSSSLIVLLMFIVLLVSTVVLLVFIVVFVFINLHRRHLEDNLVIVILQNRGLPPLQEGRGADRSDVLDRTEESS